LAESSRRTDKELAQTYAEEEGLLFLEASAKTGDNVRDIFMRVVSRNLLLSSIGRKLIPPPRRRNFRSHRLLRPQRSTNPVKEESSSLLVKPVLGKRTMLATVDRLY
jgi:hypothetical protein